MVLSPMLNEFGKVIGDFTIAQVDKNKFYIWGSQNAQKHHMRWFHKHLNKEEDVSIDCIDLKMVGLSVSGPQPRDTIQKLIDPDI
jgi:dimethylglycine dehydrogenase